MIGRVISAGFLIACAAPAFSANGLWGGIAFGMTKEQVSALYPTSETDLGGDCKAKIKALYRNEGVRAVLLDVKPAGTDGLGGRKRCSDTVIEGLNVKYGSPVAVDTREARGLEAFGEIKTVWLGGAVMVTHILKPGPNLTTILYEVAPAANSRPDISNKL